MVTAGTRGAYTLDGGSHRTRSLSISHPVAHPNHATHDHGPSAARPSTTSNHTPGTASASSTPNHAASQPARTHPTTTTPHAHRNGDHRQETQP